MPNVLFVAPEQMRCLDWLAGWVASRPGTQVTVSEAPSLQAAESTLATAAPVLVVAPSQELPSLDAFLKAVVEHQRMVAVTAIFVHLQTPEYGLIIHEWDMGGRVFTQRRCSLAHLQREIDLVLQRSRVPPEVHEKLRGIGFYDCLTEEGQTLHVQTEVAGRSEPCIRTTVHRDGAILSATTVPWPPGLHDREAATAVVREQHDHMVSKIRNRQQS